MSKRDDFLNAMNKTGRVTLVIETQGDKVTAHGEGGVKFRLNGQPGWTVHQILGSPTFTDQKGRVWRGRYYPQSKSAHFQRTHVKMAKAKAKATKKRAGAKAKKPSLAKAAGAARATATR